MRPLVVDTSGRAALKAGEVWGRMTWTRRHHLTGRSDGGEDGNAVGALAGSWSKLFKRQLHMVGSG